MNRLLISLLLLFALLPVQAADLASDVRERLSQPEVLRGEFEQAKTVQGFAKPLVSKGDFLVARGKGVLWRTREPFASELRLTRNEIQATQGGAVSFKLDAGKEPAVRLINSLMFALLNGDVSQLSELFSLSGSTQGRSWTLQLAPKQAGLAQLLKHVELQGDGLVRRVLIDEANGDKTVIRFLNPRSEPASLSAAEAARFVD
jgi:hypothetical protein